MESAVRASFTLALFAFASVAGAQQPSLWNVPIDDHEAGFLTSTVAKKGLVFVGGSEEIDDAQNLEGALLMAFHAASGELAWLKQGDPATGNGSGSAGESFFAPLALSKSVIVAGGGREVAGPGLEGFVRAYDQKTGTLLWTKKYPGAYFTEVAAVGKRAFVATTLAVESNEPSIFLAAYDLFSGVELWSETHGPVPEDPLVLALAASGKRVAVVGRQRGAEPGSHDAFVRVHDAKTGAFRWGDVFDAGDGVDQATCAAIRGKRLFVGGVTEPEGGDDDGLLRAYKVGNGKVLWTQTLPAAGSQSVQALGVHGNRVVTVCLLGDLDYLVRAHDAKSGAVRWDEELGVHVSFVTNSIVLNGSRCIVPTSEGVFALAAKTGAPVWDAPFPGAAASRLGKRVFVTGFDEVAAFPVK